MANAPAPSSPHPDTEKPDADTLEADTLEADTPAQDLPLLVLGGDPADLPKLDRVTYVTDPARPYAGVAIIGRGGPDMLGRNLAVHRHFLVPVMDFSQTWDGRADFSARTPTAAALRDGLAAFMPVLHRIEELPDLSAAADNHSLSALGLAYTRQVPIEARWSANEPDAVRYPLLAGIPAARETLEDLAEAELLRRRFFDRVNLCGNCRSARIIAREVCLNCGSSNLEEVALVHHYQCGYQAPEHEFLERQFECPKCHRELRHLGVDYDKPGSVMVCRACGEAQDAPDVRFACTDCGHETPGEGAETRDWFHYELTDDGSQALLAGELPRMGFERLLEPYRQARPLREFVALVEHDLETSTRYKRPFTLILLRIGNIADLRQRLGQREANAIFATVVEQVAETLRETDLVTARGDEILLALPETSSDAAAIAVRRMRDGTADALESDLDLDFDIVDRDSVAARLAALAEVA